MPSILYVGLQDEDKVVAFDIDGASGRLTRRGETSVPGGPSVMALSGDRRTLYVGARTTPSLSSFRIGEGGALSLLGTAPQKDAPTFLAPDRAGRFMLIAYYQGGYAAVHPIGGDGAVGADAVDHHDTANGAHAIATDRSNRYAFVPHIARLQDNVLEPPKNNPGPNFIAQFKFDAQSGRLSPNSPARLDPGAGLGPRHYIFHPSLDLVYFSNEQGCSVTAYRLDGATGALSAVQTVSTLPAGWSGRNTCSQIHLTPGGRFLYVGNRGQNSIAGFAVDPATGQLTAAGHAPTEAVPSAFGLDPQGNFLYAAGTASNRLAAYRIDGASGALTALDAYAVGRRPAAVQAVQI